MKIENFAELIIEVRKERVLLNADVAQIYGVKTRDINKVVAQNPYKFSAGYLVELTKPVKDELVEKFHRRSSSFNTQRVDHIYQDPHVENANFKLHYGDLNDTSNLVRIVQETQPDGIIFNLGAQSHVAVSFESPEYTDDIRAMCTLRLQSQSSFAQNDLLGLAEDGWSKA